MAANYRAIISLTPKSSHHIAITTVEEVAYILNI